MGQQHQVNNKKEQKSNNKPTSRYQQRIGSFYNFQISQQKLIKLQSISKKKAHRYFITGIVFGFVTEYMLGNTKIYDNAVDRATMRRLNAKLKQDQKIGHIKLLKEKNKLQQRQ